MRDKDDPRRTDPVTASCAPARTPWDQQLAGLLVGPLARLGVHPNLVTAVGLLAGLGAGVLYGWGDSGLADWGALLFMYAVLNDHLDGELARRTGRTSRFGHYFDHIAAGLSYVALFLGAGIGFAGGPLGVWSVPLGALAGLCVALIFSVRVWVEETVSHDETRQHRMGGFEAEDILYIVGPLTWLGLMQPFLVLAALGAPLYLAWTWRAAMRSRARRAEQRS